MSILRNYFWSILLSAVIIVLSTIPVPEVPELQDVPLFDKWVHFVMYGGLTLAIWYDYYRKRVDTKVCIAMCVWSSVYSAALGGIMELVQAYLTTCRSGDWIDFYADSIGVFLGLIIGILLVRKIASKIKWLNI